MGSIAHFLLSTGWYVTPALGAAVAAGLLVLVGATRVCPGRRDGRPRRWPWPRLRHGLAQYFFAPFPWIALVAWSAVAAVRGARPALALALVLPQLAATALYLSAAQVARRRGVRGGAAAAGRRGGLGPGERRRALGDRDPRRVREPEEVLHLTASPVVHPTAGPREVGVAGGAERHAHDLRPRLREVRRYIAENYQLVERFPVLAARPPSRLAPL